MSWYNNTSTDFIDATQTYTGGSTSIVNGGDDVSNTPSGNITDLIQLVNNDTYVKNIYTDGRIYFYVKDAGNDSGDNYNTRINKDGNLQYYHSFSILTPQKLSGWYDVGGAIAGLETGAIITGASVATNSTLILQLETSFSSFLTADYAPFKVATIQNDAIMYELINTLRMNEKGLKNWSTSGMYGNNVQGAGERTLNLLDAISDNLQTLTPPRSITNMGLLPSQVFAGRVPQIAGNVTELVATRANALGGWLQNLGNGLTYAGIAGGIYAIYTLIDSSSEEEERDSLMGIANLREQIQKQIADGTGQDLQTNTYIYVDSLTIDQTTNNGYTTAGIYIITITNDAILELKIENNPSSVLVASIVNVLKSSDQFSLNDEIFISKTDLNGTGADLRIVVSALRSLEYIAEKNDIYLSSSIFERQNRQRRRQYIPNKDDFSDGLNVTETFTSEPTGESLSQINISLKLDTSQFNYDASGNLQLNNYSQIAQNQTDIATNTANLSTNTGNISAIDTRTGNLETYTASLQTQINTANTNISQNATDIGNNATQISTNQTINQLGISTNAQSIITINNTLSTIQTDINNLQSSDTDVYKLLLNNNETYSTTTDHIVNIGFNKEEFSSVLFNLIMGAVKVASGLNDIPFSITDFSRYYFGLYPSATRLNYDPVITLVKQDNSKYYNDTNWNSGGLTQFGAYYFTNISSGVVYDLNKRFECYLNIRFRTLDSSGNNYILRTAYEFEEVVGTPSYAHDINKMAFYYRDGNFYFSHLCKYNLTYYAIRLNQDILSDFLNPLVTFSNTTPVYGNSAGYLDLNITGGGFSEQLYLSIKESFYSVSQATIEGLINTSANSNPLFCGMVQSTQLTNHDPFGIIRLEYPQYTSGNLFKIARLEIEYQIMRNNGYYDSSGSWVSTGWIPAIPQTQQDLNNMYEELVIEFYQSYSDTSPTLTTLIDTRQFYTTTTNTIIIDFDLSPDLYTYTYEKWIIKPRFTAQFSSGYPAFGVAGYHLVPNQRSAFIHKVKMFRYIQKTIAREQVEEFSDGVNHTLSTFNYNKMTLHIALNRNTAPFQDIWYKLNDNLDANKYTITIPQTFNTTNLSDITDLPPNVLSLPVDSINLTQPFFISQGQSTITESNHILIIGDENLSNRLYITHYGWRFLLPTDNDITETDLDNLDYVKNYNYYHRTAVCDRFLSCKEFYADVIDFKRLLIDGSLSYDEMTTSEFGTLSNSSDGNNIKSLASVNIQNLYGLTASGYLYFDTTNGFSTNSGSGGSSYWTQLNAVTIYYPNTIECDRVNATTLVLSGVASSITFSDGTFLQTASGLNAYTDADVRNVLSQSASPSISWDANNNFFVVNQSILSDIANNNTAITTNTANIATNTADLTTIFNDISFTNPSYLTFAKNIQLPNGDVISSVYTDADVRNVLSQSASPTISWNATYNSFELDAVIIGLISNNNLAITANNADITTNANNIATNTGNIATNANNIATNTNNIATNTANIAANTADLTAIFNSISFSHPAYLSFAKNIVLPNGDIISSVYNDTNVLSVLQNSAGDNLVWNATTNKIDLETNLSIGSGFTYNNATGTLSVTKFSGNGSLLTQLDAGNVSTGTLPVLRGGTGKTSYSTTGGLLIGNPSGNPYLISQDANLTYDVITGVLKVNVVEFADQTQISTAPTTYNDADVRNVLSQSASSSISWDATNNYFELDSSLLSVISTNIVNIATNSTNIITNTGDIATIFNDISFTNPTTLIIDKDIDVLNKIIVGKGGNAVNSTPTIFLDGANQNTISSQIIFGDSGSQAGTYKQGFSINYDSADNKLKISADHDADSVLDTPHYLTISRGTGNVGISNDVPTEKLDVAGNIKLSGNINFSDGSLINSNKLYLCKLKYVNLGNLATASTWVYKQNQFNTTFLINEGGFTLGTNGIIIPVSGYYEIHINNYFDNITTDRGSLISALAINGAFSNEDYICGTYIRFDSGLRGSRGNNGTITRYLTQGDQIATAWFESGDSSVINIGLNGSSFTLRRIG